MNRDTRALALQSRGPEFKSSCIQLLGHAGLPPVSWDSYLLFLFQFFVYACIFGRQWKLLGTSESDNPIRIKLTNALNPNSFKTMHCKAS